MKDRTYHQIANITKGFANHRRIEIMFLLAGAPKLTVWEIANALNVNYKTISEHIIRLMRSGLVAKKYRGKEVLHQLTNRGKQALQYMRKIA